MIESKLTAKARRTIPRPAREAVRLEAGDGRVYRIEGRAEVESALPRPLGFE
jgi:bifunctional DNA-binding transcriptional regulator/antitoxin component of YhaV-PrlF toxin-antitoxin module